MHELRPSKLPKLLLLLLCRRLTTFWQLKGYTGMREILYNRRGIAVPDFCESKRSVTRAYLGRGHTTSEI